MTGCVSTEVAESGDVNQDAIYQRYYVDYDAEENEVYATATFRFGGYKGTTLYLSDGSTIELNGKKTKGEKEFLQGMVYRFTNLSTKNTNFDFVFTTTEKKEYKNSITLSPITPVAHSEKIKNHIDSQINWEGTPVGSNEQVYIYITDNKGNRYTESTSLKGANFITVSPDSLAPGLANIQLSREIERALDESTDAGGTIEGIYTSEIIPVTIEK